MKIGNTYLTFYQLVAMVAMAVLLAVSCGKEVIPSPDDGEGVSLEMSFDLPEMSTRALSDFYDGLTPADTWEAALDGQILYRVTAFLTRYRNSTAQEEVVGFRDIDLTSTLENDGGFFLDEGRLNGKPTRAKLVFDGKKVLPGHPAGEILKEGVYGIYVIANWSGFESDGNVYPGNNDVNKAVTALKAQLNGKYGLSTGSKEWSDFIELKGVSVVPSSGTNMYSLCKKEPMPLTYKTTQLFLNPGNNHLGGSLIRTRARIRIEMVNESKMEYINISKLELGKISREETCLFEKVKMPGSAASVPVDNENSIVPFNNATVMSIPGIYRSETEKNPAGANCKVLFDAYIFESRNTNGQGDGYWYQFNISHSSEVLNKKTDNSSVEKKIFMKRIAPELDNALVDLTEIRRNQLLRIKIAVRYNVALGKLEYEVSNWTEKEGNIEFH